MNNIGYKTYGGFELQIGDNDSETKWEGGTQSDEGPYVKELQKDLAKLGYWVGDAINATHNGMLLNGIFDRFTRGAVQLFQLEHLCLDTNKKIDISKVPPAAAPNLKMTRKVDKETASQEVK